MAYRTSERTGYEQGGVQLHCDSQSAIYLAKNQVYHARTKHIDVRFHKIRELITSGQIEKLKTWQRYHMPVQLVA